MKKLFLLILIVHCTLLIDNCMCQWFWQNPTPSASALGRAFFLNENTGWIPSAYGMISKTTNGGLNWIDQSWSNSNGISGIFFINSLTGWAVGNNGLVIKSINGGTNWTQQTSNTAGGLYCVRFINSETGWVGGAWNIFLRTTNGGNNWIFSNQIGDEIYCMSFVNSQTGWLSCSNGHIQKTTDGGVTFQTTLSQNFYNEYIIFNNENTGWLTGSYGGYGLYKTTNAGNNWIACTNSGYAIGGGPIYFKDVNTGWVAGTTKLIKTTDGGISWNDSTHCASFLNFIYFSNNNTGFVGGSGNELGVTPCMYKTTNGGVDWKSLVTGINYTFSSIFVVNPNTAYITGDYNTIVKTSNGGINWDFSNYAIKNNDGKNISSVYFINEQTGWAACYEYSIYYGLLFKTTNSGLNWNKVDSNYQHRYDNLFFVNQNTGYAAGFNVIKKTTNGGSNWFELTTNGRPNYYRSLCFLNETTGWIASGNNDGTGGIFKTTDGGLNWNSQNIPQNKRILSLQFVNQNTGFSAGNFNGILKTTNGGDKWYLVNDSIVGILSIYFFDANRGWAVGHYGSSYGTGLIAKTSNGGVNWETLPAKTRWSLNCVKFANEYTGWIVGSTGVILKTSTGGITFESVTSSEVPQKFLLCQNYPNPFNPSTIIKFMIPSHLSSPNALFGDLVLLKVYDILGREIAILVNERLKPGTYEIPFSFNQFSKYHISSGIYFYKLQTNEYSETKKMVLLK